MPTLPSVRKEAIQSGSRFYQTVKPCKHGHKCPRWTINGACVECTVISNRAVRKRKSLARKRGRA